VVLLVALSTGAQLALGELEPIARAVLCAPASPPASTNGAP
jgi:hypothetical protein